MQVTVFTDGGSRGNPGLAASAYFAYDEAGKVLQQEGIFLGVKTNNEAEYQAFAASVDWLLSQKLPLNITQVSWKLDSLLVVEQLQKHWKIKDARMAAFVHQIWGKLAILDVPYTIRHVPRSENAAADRLVNETLDAAA